MMMDKDNMQHQAQYDYNAYAALILLLNGFWRICMTDEQRKEVARCPDTGQVQILVNNEQLHQMGFDEDVEQLCAVLRVISDEWVDENDVLLPFEFHQTSERQLRVDMAKDVFLTIILLDGFDVQV